jgi:streptogramin lyase
VNFSNKLAGLSVAMLALGTACSGPSAPAAPSGSANATGVSSPRVAGWIAPNSSAKGVIYLSSFSGNTVYLYTKKLGAGANPAPIGEITDGVSGPSGSFVDKQGDLFVANDANFTVTMYPAGSTTWTRRYTGFAYPLNVAVDSKGSVFIVDFTGEKVVQFPKGSTRSKLTIPIGFPPHGVALDAHGNVYVSYNTGSHGGGPGSVNEYAPGSKTGKNLNLPIGWAAGDATDGSGNLLVADQSNAAVYVFAPGSSTPSQTISQGLEDPVNIAFDSSFKHLYVEDAEVDGVLVYDYPSGKFVTTLNNGATSIDGVAVSPEGL